MGAVGAVGAVCSVQCAAPGHLQYLLYIHAQVVTVGYTWAIGHLGTWADRWTCDVTLSIRALGALGARGADVDYLAIPTHL